MRAIETIDETIDFKQLATATDRQNDDDGSLVVLDSLELSIVTGGVDQSDFERYGQAIGEDIGGMVRFKSTGREIGRDLGRRLWAKWKDPGFAGFLGGLIGAGFGL